MQTHPNQRTAGLLGFGALASKSKSAVARVQAALKRRAKPVQPTGPSHLAKISNPVEASAKVSRTGAYAAGRVAERKRCAAIFASPHATRNLEMAAELAFGTDMTPSVVIAQLRRMPSAERAARMAQGPRVDAAAAWDAAFAAVARSDARGELLDGLTQPQHARIASSDVTTSLKKASGWVPDEEARAAGAKVSEGWDDALQTARHQVSTNRN